MANAHGPAVYKQTFHCTVVHGNYVTFKSLQASVAYSSQLSGVVAVQKAGCFPRSHQWPDLFTSREFIHGWLIFVFDT